MQESSIITMKLPPISNEFFDRLNVAFNIRPVTPSTPIEAIMYHAGQRSVVDWCKQAKAGKPVQQSAARVPVVGRVKNLLGIR